MSQIIHSSPLPDVDIPNVPVTEYVMRMADQIGDRTAITDGERSYSFAQLRDLIKAFAGGLAARGFGPGHTLALMAPNIPEYAIVFHGVATAGGTITTINPTYGAEEVRHQLLDSGATMLITIEMFADTARKAIEGTPIEQLHVLGAETSGDVVNAMDLLGEPIEQVAIDPKTHVVVLPYSSGTTGLPKGVMLTH